jgi:hypothetical protein
MVSALTDIAKHNREYYQNKVTYDEYLKQMDYWVVGYKHLCTKEVRRLNKLLGMRGINHLGNKKGCKNKLITKNQ